MILKGAQELSSFGSVDFQLKKGKGLPLPPAADVPVQVSVVLRQVAGVAKGPVKAQVELAGTVQPKAIVL